MNLLADVGIASGHVLLADWLFLLAVVVFVIEVIVLVANRPAITRGVLPAVGLALIALGWLVL
jgi:hypothetical protein